jgi:hypothetical protein
VIKEEEEEDTIGEISVVKEQEGKDEEELLTKEERELKRKGIRDMRYKAEYNMGGIMNCQGAE